MSLQQTALQQTWLSNNLPDTLTQSSNTVSTDTRRMSEPCHTFSDRKSPPPRPASVTLSPLKTPVDIHPNQAVVLDEVGEGEMVENKLVIPDEMVHYLNQVADTQNGDFNSVQWTENRQSTSVEQKQASNTGQIIGSPSSQMLLSPNSVLPSPTQNFGHMLPSPQNTNVLSPSAVNQIMPSPNNMNQMLPSPANNLNQIMPSPTGNMNQMLPSPGPSVNQMMPSPAANTAQIVPSPSSNVNQMMPSPPSNFNQMVASPSSNYGNVQNPLVSPTPVLNQMMASPQTNMNMVQSPMSVRCQSQIMSPDTTTVNQNMMMMTSGSHTMQNTGHIMQNSQNCAMMSQNQILQNGHISMNQNQCYNTRSMNHNMCYMQHGDNTWNNSIQMQQRGMCQNQNEVQQNNHITMCHSRSTNVDYNSQCRQQVQQSNSTFINSGIPPQNPCNNHNYQMCNTNNYVNSGCHTNKHANSYSCNTNTYSSMQPTAYGCVPNINEPLTSPAMAAPAPTDTVTQPQQAQMSRPCVHYGQNCYRYNNQCASNQNVMCNCVKVNIFPQTTNNKCYHQCSSNSEIQCKDVSQSQMSPAAVNSMNTNVTPKNPNSANVNTVQPYGMRQDAYQRTLEYVQNCQSWVSSSEMFNSTTTNPVVKCVDTSSSNMVVNDMTSSLSSLLEENRYLQMIQ